MLFGKLGGMVNWLVVGVLVDVVNLSYVVLL